MASPSSTSNGDAYHHVDSIIQFSDEAAKEAARHHYCKQVEESLPGHLDLNALRICVRLVPSSATADSVSVNSLAIVHVSH